MSIPEWTQYALITVVGIGVLAFLIWRLSPLIFFNMYSVAVKGRITNWMSMKEKGTTYFYPMIEFETADGNMISTRADDRCEGRPMYPVGTSILVRYRKKDPKSFRVDYPEA